MKISLITTLPTLAENKRLEEETKKLGHQFTLTNSRHLNFEIKNNKLDLPGITDTKANLIIFRGIFTSLRSYQPLIEHLRKKGIKVFDNNLSHHQYSINKITDLIKLTLHDIKTPNAVYAPEFTSYQTATKKIGYPLIIKSTRAGKGFGVNKIDNEEDLKNFIQDAQEEGKIGKGYLMQEFIPYIHDLRILIIGDQMFTMRRIPKEGEFRANFSLGGSVELFNPQPETITLAKKALKAIDMTTAGIDVLITKDNQQYVLEVNHTPGFVGMEKATNKNIAQIFIKHAIKTAK